MKLKETKFTKELEKLLNKYKVGIGHDKESLILYDNKRNIVVIGEPETGSDGTDKRLYLY